MSSNYPELFNTIYNGKTYHQSESLIPSFSRLVVKEEFSNIEKFSRRSKPKYTTKNTNTINTQRNTRTRNTNNSSCNIHSQRAIKAGNKTEKNIKYVAVLGTSGGEGHWLGPRCYVDEDNPGNSCYGDNTTSTDDRNYCSKTGGCKKKCDIKLHHKNGSYKIVSDIDNFQKATPIHLGDYKANMFSHGQDIIRVSGNNIPIFNTTSYSSMTVSDNNTNSDQSSTTSSGRR
tara:strand:+ start:481 stop:1170 length:690 start_codon:yes stop_codon:yes gene_type:complete